MRSVLAAAAVALLAAPASSQYRAYPPVIRSFPPVYRPIPPVIRTFPPVYRPPVWGPVNPVFPPIVAPNPWGNPAILNQIAVNQAVASVYPFGFGMFPAPYAVPVPVPVPAALPAPAAAPQAAPAPPAPVVSTPPTGPTTFAPQRPFSWFPPEKSAHELRVYVPVPDAKVTVNGAALDGGGTERTLTVDKIKGGESHEYTVVATWTADGKPVTREKKVRLDGTSQAVADFRSESK